MARKYGQGRTDDARKTAGTGMALSVAIWLLFALVSVLVMKPFVRTSAKSPQAVEYAVVYGSIVCGGSLGVFLEGNWTKVLQAGGNMRLPMLAQIAGALTNIVLDPILIFGLGFFPEMGVAGAAWATVCGQLVAAAITGAKAFCPPPGIREMAGFARRIFRYAYPSILMQAMYTVYIVLLNIILAGFSDAAVTVLGLYYKLQSFFFIPLFGLQTCIVPVLSFNYARAGYERCRQLMKAAMLVSTAFMLVGIVCFVAFPRQVIGLFSNSAEVFAIGETAFPIIATSFVAAVFTVIMPAFFQAIGDGKTSVMLSLLRQIFCLVPLFWLFSRIGLNYAWLAFPVSEAVSGGLGLLLYQRKQREWN